MKGELISMIDKLFGITTALAETAAMTEEELAGASATGQLITTVLMMVVMFGLLYFMMIRPQRKKEKKVKEMLDNLKVTDRVTTIGGIHGTIVGIRDDNMVLSVGKDNLEMVVARWAIRNVAEDSLENETESLN